ncbi:MAG: ribosome biogenesis GTP-binding protein YihA/YsxC [Acidobacteriota bacterium]
MKIGTAEFVLSAKAASQFRRDGRPEVAFVGRSNVGKSSLMNKLLGRKGLARTSSRPGRTQAVNYFLINDRLYFVDLPGYGFAKASRAERQSWAELMNLYFRTAEERDVLLIQLVDAKVGATALDVQAGEYFHDLGFDPVVVATKVDKLPRSKRVRGLRSIREALGLGEGGAVPCSATTGEGMGQVWNEIRAFLAGEAGEPQPAAGTT